MKFPKRTIKQNRYDNWYGYVGGKLAEAFCNDGERTQEENAHRWLETQTSADEFIEDLLKAEDAIAGLSNAADDEDIIEAVKQRAGFKDVEQRVHALAQDLSDTIDSL